MLGNVGLLNRFVNCLKMQSPSVGSTLHENKLKCHFIVPTCSQLMFEPPHPLAVQSRATGIMNASQAEELLPGKWKGGC